MYRKVLATVLLAFFALALPATAQDKTVNQVSITATIRTYVLEAPRANAELVGILQSGVKVSAFGRDADADWLRIMDGWVLSEVFNTVGEVGALPDATNSVNVAVSSAAQLYDGPSAKWFSVMGDISAGTKAVALGRNESGSWLRLPQGWIEVMHVEAAGDIRPLPVTPSGVIITAKTRTFILADPDLSAEFFDVFEAGEEALAIGRAGDWIQIDKGWVSADAVSAIGDLASIEFTGQGIQISYSGNSFATVKSQPELLDYELVRRIRFGEQDLAIGRTEDGKYLFVGDGWVLARSFDSAGDIMTLPVTDGSIASNSALLFNATATPRPATRSTTSSSWTTSTIRTLVSRHTDDIRILDLNLDISSSATTIEYDLKPWPFVPNEQIANEVAFKIICALRRGQQIPTMLKLIGQSHFKSDIGRKFKSPSVEIHISARRANSIICAGNDYSDINWRSVSSLYKSYPIPRGASVDYD